MNGARPSRPSTILAAVLGGLFLLARPETFGDAIAVLGWLLTNPAGAVIIGAALAVTLIYCAVTYRGHHGYAYSYGHGHGWGRHR